MVDSTYYENYCELLWEEYILVCVELIESKQYEMCKEKYVEMMNRLKKLIEEEK